MMGGVSPETCWASRKCGVINFDTLLRLAGYFCMNYTMMHGSTNIKLQTISASLKGCYFTQLFFSTKGAHFFKVYYHTPCNSPIFSNVSIVPTSQVCTSSMLLLLFKRNKHYGIRVTTSGITFIISLIKISPPVQKLKWAQWKHSNLMNLVSFLMTGKV